MRKLILVAALAAVMIAGCTPATPMSSEYTGNGIQVQKLFTKDNCTIYKFYDGDIREVYYADCTASVTVSDEINCGKGCTQPEMTVTPKHIFYSEGMKP